MKKVIHSVDDSGVWQIKFSLSLVICELVICELIVRTTDANLRYNANQKVRTFKRGPYTCLCIRNTEMTFITIQNTERNRLSVHVTKIPQNYRCGSRAINGVPTPGGLVICELRTGELVICELIVRTTDANLGYNANQKVRTLYAIKRGPYTCLPTAWV